MPSNDIIALMPYIAIHPKNKKPTKALLSKLGTFDRIVVVVSVIYPLSALPQAITVFSGKTEGVSLISWLFFLICAGLFLTYGIRRNVLPMIISNSIWLVMDALVVIGLITNGTFL